MKRKIIKNFFNQNKSNRRIISIFTFILIFSTLTINSILIFHVKFTTNNFNSYSNNLENSAPLWATLSLTNPAEINESRFTLGSTISIQGRLYNSIPPTEGKDGYTVDIEINDVVDSNFNDITQGGGYFQIDYTIDLYLDVYSRHKISVSVRNPPPDVDIINTDYYIIDVNTTSNFEITYYDTSPKLTEEKFNIIGSLRYDNGLGIPNKQVDYVWLDGLTTVDADFFISGETGGLSDPQIPITSASDLTLKLNYSEPPFVSYSERFIYNIKVFSDVQWDLNIDYTTTEGATYILTGTLFSSTDPSLRISNREVEVYFNNTYVTSATTDTNGYFTSSFIVPLRNGTASIHVQLVNIIGKDISSVPQYILVESAPPTLPGGGGLPPFLLFSIIFFPILGGVVAGLAVYGYKYYKKQEKESRVINLPLESKINNLKILKDSGRLEESISYLFNAIYMDLINAKYNRTRNDNETIRDFAIVSVKELRLTPSSIYPFIQKVEEIIYAKPFKITDKDFYNTCELFSPIYFQLTGYNFVLNF